ncbi:MAG: MEDS domain-containing protein [Fidelibacterota bacterium]
MYIKTSDQEKVNMGFGNYQCNWGLHIAGLYETEKERDEIIFGYFNQGLKENDLILYCPAERTKEDFFEKFSDFCPHCKDEMKNHDKISLSSTRTLYYPTGTFSPWDMDDGLNHFFHDSQKQGKRNVRSTAEMVWALDDTISGREHLMAYESRLNYFIPGKPWISICMYNVTKFPGDTIMNVLKTHPFTINGGIITQNPYYMDPDKYLAKFAPQFLDRNRPEPD